LSATTPWITTEERTTVRLTRRFDRPPARVFQAWTDPAKVQAWAASPDSGEALVRVELNPRVGRSFALVVRRAGEEVRHSGEYIEVVKPRRLVFTWVVAAVSKETTLVSIDLQAVWSGTDLTLKHERVLPAERTRTEARWAGILDTIASLVST
jgi:uncharacterized protein YndB with AHSA1/START domain